MEELRILIEQKDGIEKEIEKLAKEIELIDEVKSFSKGLTDAEGFPRADIDFGQLSNYRLLKRRKAELNNDHLALMKEIESKLFAYHSTLPKLPENTSSETSESKGTSLNFKKKEEKLQPQEKQKVQSKIDYLTPFAVISLVSQHSPAAAAGLKAADLLSEFADVTVYSMDWLKLIAGAVREGVSLKVVVMRLTVQEQSQSKREVYRLKDGNYYEKLTIQLMPSRWEGKGLLGCKIDPLK